MPARLRLPHVTFRGAGTFHGSAPLPITNHPGIGHGLSVHVRRHATSYTSHGKRIGGMIVQGTLSAPVRHHTPHSGSHTAVRREQNHSVARAACAAGSESLFTLTRNKSRSPTALQSSAMRYSLITRLTNRIINILSDQRASSVLHSSSFQYTSVNNKDSHPCCKQNIYTVKMN